MNPIHITSWGLARALARGGKKPKTFAAAHPVPVLIETVDPGEAPVAARRPGAADHDPSVVRSHRGRLLAPVAMPGVGPVDASLLSAPALQTEGGIFHVPRPKAVPGRVDDLGWREILDDGLQEAVRLASHLAAGFVLIDGILHREVEPPVWTVRLDLKGAVPSIGLAVGRFAPPRAGHAVRFPLSDRAAAFATAERIHRRLGWTQLVWPPRNAVAIEVSDPEAFAPAAAAMFSEDLRREVLSLGHDPGLAVLPPEGRREWVSLRRLLDDRSLDPDAALDRLAGIGLDGPRHDDPTGFLDRANRLRAVLESRLRPDARDSGAVEGETHA
jgi:hypothetical protein